MRRQWMILWGVVCVTYLAEAWLITATDRRGIEQGHRTWILFTPSPPASRAHDAATLFLPDEDHDLCVWVARTDHPTLVCRSARAVAQWVQHTP